MILVHAEAEKNTNNAMGNEVTIPFNVLQIANEETRRLSPLHLLFIAIARFYPMYRLVGQS
jgi:hypothetical protein